jgi:hypothetical protein
MKFILNSLVVTAMLLNLASCSCAIKHTWIQAKSGGKITSSTFQAAAKDSGFKAIREEGSTYHKRGVYLSYSTEERILIHSAFCPTPITLITWGADIRAWQARCNGVETSLFTWYAERGVTLKKVIPSRSNEEAQQVGTSNGG